jgi:hypothetical protein
MASTVAAALGPNSRTVGLAGDVERGRVGDFNARVLRGYGDRLRGRPGVRVAGGAEHVVAVRGDRIDRLAEWFPSDAALMAGVCDPVGQYMGHEFEERRPANHRAPAAAGRRNLLVLLLELQIPDRQPRTVRGSPTERAADLFQRAREEHVRHKAAQVVIDVDPE